MPQQKKKKSHEIRVPVSWLFLRMLVVVINELLDDASVYVCIQYQG